MKSVANVIGAVTHKLTHRLASWRWPSDSPSWPPGSLRNRSAIAQARGRMTAVRGAVVLTQLHPPGSSLDQAAPGDCLSRVANL